MDEPLDFEKEEDPLLPAPRPTKRKKIIGLDDLLLDYFETGKDKLKVKPTKSNRRPREYGSDDENTDVRENEITFCKLFEDCEEKAKELDARDDVPPWGQQIFGCQKAPLNLNDMGVEACQFLQSFCVSEHLGFDLEIQQGLFLSQCILFLFLTKLYCIFSV